MKKPLFRFNENDDEYYSLPGIGWTCEYMIRCGEHEVTLLDLVKSEIKWFGVEDDFFEYMKSEKGKDRSHFIELDEEAYLDYLKDVLKMQKKVIFLN